MRDVLFLCSQERDRAAVRAAALDSRYRVTFVGEDVDRLDTLDPEAILAAAAAVPADGVAATKDRSALLAAVLAERRGLPGPAPGALISCQHKPTSRLVQRLAAPDSTPRVALLGEGLPFTPPFFVKPVVGRLSAGARRIDDPSELAGLADTTAYADGYEAIAALAGGLRGRARGYLAETLLEGREVTLEGYVHRGRVTTIGVTDSVMYPGTISFERFEYPSALPEERQAELAVLAKRIVLAHGLDDACFNVEFIVPDAGPPGIVELNARLASQFAPLVHRLHGRSTYEVLVRLACGEDPRWRAAPPDGVAVSYVLRVFDDALVEAVPEPEEGLEILAAPGRRLSEQGVNDDASYRLAILTGFGETQDEAVARCRERAAALSFRLSPVPAPAPT